MSDDVVKKITDEMMAELDSQVVSALCGGIPARSTVCDQRGLDYEGVMRALEIIKAMPPVIRKFSVHDKIDLDCLTRLLRATPAPGVSVELGGIPIEIDDAIPMFIVRCTYSDKTFVDLSIPLSLLWGYSR